jgi:hypothetical protein
MTGPTPRKPPINVTAQPQVPTTYNPQQPLATAQPYFSQMYRLKKLIGYVLVMLFEFQAQGLS